MRAFPDTSFLYSIYREQIHSVRADQFLREQTTPLPVSSLLLFEFRQSTRLQVWLHTQDRSRGFSQRAAAAMLRNLESDLADRVVETAPIDWPHVHHIAECFSAKHTSKQGHRFVDILHVATAIHREAEQFLTFDENQRLLAEAENLAVPV